MALFSPSSQSPLGLHPGRAEKVRVKARAAVKVGTIVQFELDGNDAAVTASASFGGSGDSTANVIASIASEALNTNVLWHVYGVCVADIADDGEGWVYIRGGSIPLAWDAAESVPGQGGTPGVSAGLISLVSANAERVVAIPLDATTTLYVSGNASTLTNCIFDGVNGLGQFNA